MRTRMHPLFALMTCCSLLFILPITVKAEEGPKEDKVFELGEIVVTEQTPAAESVATVTERNRKDFQAWSDYSVADALRGIPGGEVTLAPGGLPGNGKQESLIRLRGFETTDVMIMIDGMPVTEPNMKRVDLNQIILDNVAKIKVIKGPSSVLYGPNTAGGVINIVTQEGDEFRATLEQRFGDYKTFRTIGQHRGVVGPVRYTLGGSYDVSDGFPISRDFEGTPNQPGVLRENSDYERYNLAGRLSTDLGSRGSLAVAGGYYNFDGGVPFDMLDPFPSTLWRKEWDRWYLNGAGDYAFTDSLGIKAQIFYAQFDNKITTYTDTSFEEVASDGNAVSTHDNSLFGYFLNPYWNLGRWSYIRAGIRYQKDDISIQDETGDPWYDYAAETFNFSLEDELRLLERVRFVAGVGYNLYRPLKSGKSEEGPGDDTDTVDFQAGLVYTPWTFLEAHASVGKKSTFPTMRQLYGSNGNPHLSDQRAMLYEVGVDVNYQPHLPYGSFALFYSDVDDLIGKKELEGDTWIYENVDQAVMQGLELSLFWAPINPVLLGCAYTLMDTEDKRPERALKDLDFRPRHMLSVQARYQSSFGLSVNTRYMYTSELKYEEEGIAPERNIESLPDRGVWDIHLAQKFPFKRFPNKYVEIFLDVNNILDEYYEQDPFRAAPGRLVWGGIRGEF